jgi:DNA-binding response OmpR family regulator
LLRALGIDRRLGTSAAAIKQAALPLRISRSAAQQGFVVENSNLTGRSILIVEDEPLVALDIAEGFRAAGASVLMAHKLEDGLRLAGHPDLSAAVLDYGFGDGDGAALCARLKARAVPFVLHSGYSHVDEACKAGAVVPKPASPPTLVAAITQLLDAQAARA